MSMDHAPPSVESQVRHRPALFRALGLSEPPRIVEVGGECYEQESVYKHDSWAATAVYRRGAARIICKFNRTQRIGLIPMSWLGRLLARRERYFLEQLADQPLVPDCSGDVLADGKILRNAVAHVYIEGHALGRNDIVSTQFFEQLRALLAEMHQRGIAYVDLHKRENILVGEDGLPYLIDFQISQALPRWWPFGAISRILQRSDDYHLRKHVLQFRPELFEGIPPDQILRRPWWIRAHRMIAVPFRTLRRRLLVGLKIRRVGGSATTETFPEVAVRREIEQTP